MPDRTSAFSQLVPGHWLSFLDPVTEQEAGVSDLAEERNMSPPSEHSEIYGLVVMLRTASSRWQSRGWELGSDFRKARSIIASSGVLPCIWPVRPCSYDSA